MTSFFSAKPENKINFFFSFPLPFFLSFFPSDLLRAAIYFARAAAAAAAAPPAALPLPARASLANLHAGDQHAWQRSAGARPCALALAGSPPAFNNLVMISTWPRIAAQWRGVLSPASTALGSAPAASRADTAARWPLWAARIRGVSSIFFFFF